MFIAAQFLAALFALMALGFLITGSFLDYRLRWRKRKDAPRYFSHMVGMYFCASALCAVWALSYIQG